MKDSDGGDPNHISVDVTRGDSPTNDFIGAAPSFSTVPSSVSSGARSISAGPSGQYLSSISGNVSEDIDNNDSGDDSGDKSLMEVLVTLYDSVDVVVATILTDGEGNYVFYDLPVGNYTVTDEFSIGIKDIDEGNLNKIAVDFGGS